MNECQHKGDDGFSCPQCAYAGFLRLYGPPTRQDQQPGLTAALVARCREIGVENVEREVRDILIKIERGEL